VPASVASLNSWITSARLHVLEERINQEEPDDDGAEGVRQVVRRHIIANYADLRQQLHELVPQPLEPSHL
jgi:hypothetical protein